MDTVSFGRDREPRRWLPRPRWQGGPGWRNGRAWLVILAVVVMAVAGLVVVMTRGTGRRPAGGLAAATMPPVLSGVPARGVRTSLIIGGDYVWRVGTGRPRVVLGGLLTGGVSSVLPSRGGTARISQVVPVPGGVVALMTASSARPVGGLSGAVLFIPAGAGRIRVIARATMIAVAPDGRSVWVQTAVPPSRLPGAAARPVMSTTFAVSLAGRQVGPVLRLPLGLAAVTSSGLLTDSVVTGRFQLWSFATGRPEPMSLPGGARVVGAGSGLVIWLSSSCAMHCRLYLTDLRAGRDVTIPVPAGWWPVQYQEPVASDGSDQRIAIPLGRIDSSGNLTAEDMYVVDTTARTMRPVPGGPSSAGLSGPGAGLAGAWDQGGRLWVLAVSGYGYFQLGYWTGAGPLHVYPTMPGNPAAISAPGSG